MADLKPLILRRGQIKSRLTRLISHFDEVRSKQTPLPEDLIELENRANRNLLAEYEQVHFEIINLAEDIVPHDADLNVFEKSYYTITSAISNFLKNKRSASQNINAINHNSNTSQMDGIKLPDITLPTFHGDFECWPEFHDAFDALIHKNSTLTNIQKYYYLIGSLKGEAAQALRSLKVSSENYDIAWNLLKKRFENKKLIIQNNLRALINLESSKKDSHLALQRFLDNILKIIQSLKNYGQPTVDSLLIFILSAKLSHGTRYEWELFKHVGEFPTFDEFLKFLENRCHLLGSIELNTEKQCMSNNDNKNKPYQNKLKSHTSSIKSTCAFCGQNHLIMNCNEFLKLEINTRIATARKCNLCLNCLKGNHKTKFCSGQPCSKCGKKHNSLLHIEFHSTPVSSPNQSRPETATNHNQQSDIVEQANGFNDTIINSPQTLLANQPNENINNVILSTVCVLVRDLNGKRHSCRALLDSGSQINFITNELCNRLNLQKFKSNLSISGINNKTSLTNARATICIESKFNNYKTNLSCFVLDQITGNIPNQYFSLKHLQIPQNIELSDKGCNNPAKIDILIGASLFWDLLCTGQVSLGHGKPILQKTKLGWTLGGIIDQFDINKVHMNSSLVCLNSTLSEDPLHEQLTKFWTLDECINNYNTHSAQEKFCEMNFVNTTLRDNDGRFVVCIPFKSNLENLGDSKDIALKRFYSLERKLNKNATLKEKYTKFINEYENLGHMTKIHENDINECHYYLPHHAVFKEENSKSKIRVVFDGSCKTSTGLSLNDVQYVGPTIQSDLFSILLRFRKHTYVLSADIIKMYRQVLIQENQRQYQLIFWRDDFSKPLNIYRLNTVTYGTASAPFLAIRCLKQLATECRDKDPISSNVLENDFYVDDMLTGSDSESEIFKMQSDISKILNSAGFTLGKWASNNKNLLDKLKESEALHPDFVKSFENGESKTLGILWNHSSDTLQFSVKNLIEKYHVTKRTILSAICQIFDPLGLLGPVTVSAKLIIQNLWQLKLSWDESVPLSIYNKWLEIQTQLYCLKNINIPRHITCPNPQIIELHAFCDSSEMAYGGAVYIKGIDAAGNCVVNLLCAKSRVAPLKNLSLPRLELCGALLLARLTNKVKESIKINFDRCYFWCDSTITLCWIKAPSNKWKTFVANRVAEIQNLTNVSEWNHVSSKDNPADLISRGLTPSQIGSCSLWWHGPKWLLKYPFEFPVQPNYINTTLECRSAVSVTTNEFNLFSNISSLRKLKLTVSYCLRFISNCKKPLKNRNFGKVTAEELVKALRVVITLCQSSVYLKEITDLRNNKILSNKSKILSLNPFLDQDGILRVGGRIHQSNYDYSKKHPIILPPSHYFTKLIVKDEHIRLLHCGATMLLASIRETYWPIGGRNLVRKIIHECITCFRANPKFYQPLMGALPKERVQQSPPFYNSGVDYAGPIFIKNKAGRGSKLMKAYICIFVCLSTKAVHLDLVTSLNTEEFMATLRRFIARRGKPLNLYSDNGTNFVGAKSELLELKRFLLNDENQTSISQSLAHDNISWHFIPPHSPHMGGIWEAGVKSVKFHLKRVVGNNHLTYEQFYTLLTQIEAILNSRPLCPLSPDPTDMDPLTPAHFLIGRKLTSVPEPNLLDVSENRLRRYQHIQKITQHFWNRWSCEYISQLQSRPKRKGGNNQPPCIGDLVLLREDRLPPLKWQLARISSVHPGKDGVIRVVTVTLPSGGTTKRVVNKVCVLPLNN